MVFKYKSRDTKDIRVRIFHYVIDRATDQLVLNLQKAAISFVAKVLKKLRSELCFMSSQTCRQHIFISILVFVGCSSAVCQPPTEIFCS